MRRVAENKAREKRIYNDVIVEAYESSDVVLCWLNYFENNLVFPFEAE